MKIMSKWTMEKARWDRLAQKYNNRRVESLPDKTLEMIITPSGNGDILRFIGGPTGYESYYVRDLLECPMPSESDDFCICAGTVNSWPTCIVPRSEVFAFLHAEEK